MGNTIGKKTQTITGEFSRIIHISNRQPRLIVIDDGKEYVNNFFTEFLNSKDITR